MSTYVRPMNQARGRRLVVAGAIATALGAGGVGAYAAIGSATSSPGVAEQIAGAAPGPGRSLRAYQLDGSDAVPVFALGNGDQVGLVAGSGVRCLVRTRAGRVAGESCAPDGALAEGRGISISDECGTSGNHLMEITGLAPDGSAYARLLSSDGTSRLTPVTRGAFKFDGTNPIAGTPYPDGVEWVDAGGVSTGSARLPVVGDQFCPSPG